jgi:hypothetical protein
MTAIDFPNTPEVGQVFAIDSRSWVWSGATWNSVAEPSGGNVTDVGTFYGLKTDVNVGRLYLQVTDDGSKITLPQSDVNTNGVRVRTPGEYREWVFTQIPLNFAWDTENPSHLTVEVG